VADRLLAKPGTGDYGLLTVLIGHRASAHRLLNLPPGAFRPAPKVQSTVIRLRFHAPDPPVLDETVLAEVVGAVFSRRRKTMGNALLAYGGLTPSKAALALSAAGVDPVRRPETLTIAELCRVADAVAADLAGNPTRPTVPPVL
jgi:16S rRNA (adenine1518-N6/adenine1519-N6)-dimethyltransferase